MTMIAAKDNHILFTFLEMNKAFVVEPTKALPSPSARTLRLDRVF